MKSDKNKIDRLKKTVPSEFETQNLHVKETKTIEYEVKWNRRESWKECKLLGSLLETIASTRNLKYIFYNQKLSITLKTCVFNSYVVGTFLYNSELCRLTETKERATDSSQQRKLRTVYEDKMAQKCK